ncbi:hypothetical protein ACNPQM_18755 [Streptomyces sp. NPDC056231]|uniref:hypothetical protein n=1 Tax=Streptomyces sp. NPDC056231 TaxID=3345755 RepID=UPI003AADD66C
MACSDQPVLIQRRRGRPNDRVPVAIEDAVVVHQRLTQSSVVGEGIHRGREPSHVVADGTSLVIDPS